MKTIIILGAILCMATLGVNALANTPQETANKAVITLVLNKTSATEALQTVGRLSGVAVHITAPPLHNFAFTVTWKNISADHAFNAIAQMVHLTVTYKEDGVYFTPEEAKN